MQNKIKSRQRIIIAGQIPPPIGGQNLCIKRTLDVLSNTEELKVDHLPFYFTQSWHMARKVKGGKVIELFKVIFRLLKFRAADSVDVIVHPAGGPHTIAILRDIALLPWMWLCSHRVILHFHAAGLHEYLNSQNCIVRNLVKLMYGHFCNSAIVNSTFGIADAQAAGISDIRVIPNAVNDHAHIYTPRQSKSNITILNVGHLCYDKGTPQLIRAFSKIAKIWPNTRLQLVGEPLTPYSLSALKSDIENSQCSGQVQWLGLLLGDALQAAFRDADLFVFSSIAPYESFGLVMVEAMHWSMPLVITDWRANTEICTKDFGGVTAHDPSKDLENSLETAITEALSKQEIWSTWGRTNREIYERNYHSDAFKKKFLAALK